LSRACQSSGLCLYPLRTLKAALKRDNSKERALNTGALNRRYCRATAVKGCSMAMMATAWHQFVDQSLRTGTCTAAQQWNLLPRETGSNLRVSNTRIILHQRSINARVWAQGWRSLGPAATGSSSASWRTRSIIGALSFSTIHSRSGHHGNCCHPKWLPAR
jgi:hypothetical protein